MSGKYPCRPGAERRAVILFLSGIAIAVVVSVVFCALGLMNEGDMPRTIISFTLMDIAGLVFWWYTGDL